MSETATEKSTSETISELVPIDLLKDEIDQVSQFYDVLIEFFTNYSFQLVGAFIIFIIGYVFAGKVSGLVLRLCERNKLDITLRKMTDTFR